MSYQVKSIHTYRFHHLEINSPEVIKLLHFLMNSKEGIRNYKIPNNKAPKRVTRHTTPTEERENFLLDCITL